MLFHRKPDLDAIARHSNPRPAYQVTLTGLYFELKDVSDVSESKVKDFVFRFSRSVSGNDNFRNEICDRYGVPSIIEKV